MSRTEGTAYRRLRADLRKQELPCHICGLPIDYSLKYPDDMSFSADHVEPVGNGGDNLGELKAAHLLCNKRRSNKPLSQVPILKVSREW